MNGRDTLKNFGAADILAAAAPVMGARPASGLGRASFHGSGPAEAGCRVRRAELSRDAFGLVLSLPYIAPDHVDTPWSA